nr:Neurofilament medium polypeptide like [Ipomoea batatas]
MAAKSDLAQKLLHDLRLRKERMAAAQNSGNSHSASRGGYANAGQPHRGSRQIKTLESAGSRTRNSQISGRGGNRSFHVQESAGQIVPYAAGRKIDLSMAITFAIENRGKFTKLNSSSHNSVLGFIHQIGQRSLDLGKMERRGFDKYHHPSSSQIVTLSSVQVGEISKGIQRINQILKACSDGVNFDRYSVEVGKELLKGAMDLESSLRMLVNLEETSNYMIKPQRKNRITLLDEDEDDDSAAETADQKLQLDLPRFSFDKPSRKSHSKKETSEPRLLALTYPEKTLPPNVFKALSANLEPKNQPNSSIIGAEKGRISNVIAKLMGLDEVPQNADVKASRQSSTSKKKESPELKKTAHSIFRSTSDSENKPPSNTDKKTKQSKNVLPSLDAIVPLKDGGSAMVASDTISHQKGAKQAVRQNHQSNIAQIYQLPGNLQKMEKEPPNGSSETISKNEAQPNLPQKHKMEVAENLSPQITKHRKNIHQTENKVDQQTPMEKTEAPRLQKPRKPDGMEDKHQSDRKEQKLEVRKPNGGQVETRISQTFRNKTGSVQKRQTSNGKFARPQKDLSNSIHPEELAKNGKSSGPKATMQNTDQNASPQALTSRIQKVAQEKPIKVPVIKKRESYIQVHRKEASKNIDGLDGRKGTPKPIAGPSKQQLPILQVKKQTKRNVNSSTAVKAGKSSEEHSKESNGNISEFETSEVGSEPKDKELKIASTKTSETPAGLKTETFASAVHEPLTESEKHLKETLIKSHLFLSTAEALLKLNLPISVLHATDHINQGADFKLTADCGYEVLRRKARRQELSLHPCAKICISYTKVRSLDDLIKQLCRDFDKLSSYGWNGRESCDSSQYFNNMLAKDMQNRDPDINCMWDFGWDETMFGFLEKDEIAKDVEKHLLKGLIDEITIDLL